MVHRALAAAERLTAEGIETEIIDPRTLNPLDEATILNSVRKTQRLVIAYEAYERRGVGAEFAALAANKALDYLDAPIEGVPSLNTPTPFNPKLENYVVPSEERIMQGIKRLLGVAVSLRALSHEVSPPRTQDFLLRRLAVATLINMPKLGQTVEEGTMLTWLKRQGEQVTQ